MIVRRKGNSEVNLERVSDGRDFHDFEGAGPRDGGESYKQENDVSPSRSPDPH